MKTSHRLLRCLLISALTLTASLHAETYSSWAAAEFSAVELTEPSISGESADPDGDGVQNILEYAIGTDPLMADSMDADPAIKVSEGKPSLSYKNNTTKVDVSLIIETSSDLKSWSPTTTTILSTRKGIELRQVKMPRGKIAFYRFKVTKI